MHREVSMHESRPEQQQIKLFGTEWYLGRIVGYIYISIYNCSKSFRVLLHDVMVGGWIASYVFIFIFWSRCCCCCCVLLLLLTTSVLKRREVPATASSFYVSVLYAAMLPTSIAAVLGCFSFSLRCFGYGC